MNFRPTTQEVRSSCGSDRSTLASQFNIAVDLMHPHGSFAASDAESHMNPMMEFFPGLSCRTYPLTSEQSNHNHFGPKWPRMKSPPPPPGVDAPFVRLAARSE